VRNDFNHFDWDVEHCEFVEEMFVPDSVEGL